jgi:hypothetical protein
LNFPLFFDTQYLSVFEGGLEGMGEGIDLSGVVLKLQSLVSSSGSVTSR